MRRARRTDWDMEEKGELDFDGYGDEIACDESDFVEEHGCTLSEALTQRGYRISVED